MTVLKSILSYLHIKNLFNLRQIIFAIFCWFLE